MVEFEPLAEERTYEDGTGTRAVRRGMPSERRQTSATDCEYLQMGRSESVSVNAGTVKGEAHYFGIREFLLIPEWWK
jgi:hypothetical protein